MTNSLLTVLSRARLNEHYASGQWRDETIFSLVARQARLTPERIAVRDSACALSYRELLAHSEALAADLDGAGLRRGQRVAVWSRSRVETCVAILACFRNGYACCPSLHRDHTVAQVCELLKRMHASAFIGETGYGADADRRSLSHRLPEIETLRRVITLPPAGTGGAIEALAATASLDKRQPPAPNREPDIPVYLAFTSGTTGLPKGVLHSDNTLLAPARAMIADWSFGDNTVIYSMSPLSHNLGLGAFVMAMACGGELVIHDLPRGASTFDRILEVGATFVIGVPTHALDLLAEMKARGATRAGQVRGFRISGASAPRRLVEELLQRGIVTQAGFGMTEAGSHHYTRPNDPPELIAASSGRAYNGYEVRIWSTEDPDREVGVGEIGQIGGRGSSLMLGYFDDQAANDDCFNAHGWFMTGDLGRVDAQGNMEVTGRKKDVIIRGGHNIYPARIEGLALRHPAVAQAAAVPVADERLGEKVCLVYHLHPGQKTEPEALLDHLDDSGLSKYDMPEFMLELDDIPLTASGKVLKRELVAGIGTQKLSPKPVRWRPKARMST